jgi:transposase
MRRTFKYRAYPTPTQGEALHSQVNEACRLYNAALDERRSAWRMNGISLNYYDQANQLKAIREADAVGIANFGDRWHSCVCGLSLGRDHNAARNVLHIVQGLGWSLQAITVDRYSFGASHAVA